MSTLKADLQITPQDVMSESSVQTTNLGALATTGDGRYFRYVLVGGTALVPGKLYQSAAETTGWENLACAAASAGATSITTTSTITATLNQLAGGYLTVTASTGAGYVYKIKGNTAASSAVCTIYLEDPLQTDIAVTTSTVDIVLSPFNKVELWDYSNHDGVAVGVAVYPVTAAYYGWVQVKGPASLLADSGALGVGVNVYASAAVDGAGDATATYGFIGTAMTGISASEYGIVNLNIS